MVNNSIRRNLLASTIFAGSLMMSAPAFAQSAPADDAAIEGDAIVVTGSRIATTGLNSQSPLQVIGAEAIRESGAVNIQDLLLENPAFGTPGISRTNSNFSTSSAGVATVDLRDLGSDRTLVLVNGRRFVAGVPGSSAVDLNVIPTQLIERVDVLTGGASAIYGSDAVAGVVNFIYKKDFQGVEANGQFGLSEEGDDIRRQANLTFGSNFADDRGNVIVHLGYSNEGAVFTRDREISAVDQASTGAFVTGDPNDFFKITRPFNSSFAPQGRFFDRRIVNGAPANVTVGTFDQNNNFIPGFSSNGSATRPADGFNRSALRTIAIPTERYIFASNANYEITTGIEAFFEGSYAKTITTTRLEPFPLDSIDLFPATGGYFNVENRQLDAGGNATGPIVVNPFVPAALLAGLGDSNGDGLRDVAFTRRLSDVADRGNRASRDTFRFLGGVRGDVFSDFKWEVFYGYGQTAEAQVSSGQFNVVNFRNALNVTRNAAGELVCTDPNSRQEGCVPVNVFGRNTITADGLRYIDAPSFYNVTIGQKLAGANIAGSLFDPFGQGAIGIAAGLEYRKETSSAEFDALQQAGLNGGNAIPATRGSFDVKEAYGEIRFPILTDTIVKELSINGAGRVSDYSTVGTVYSYNGGVEFAPVEALRFTAIWARSTRAPNVGELFSPPSQTFPTGLQDPCLGVTAATTGTLGTVCRSYPGVVANIAANGAFTLNQADLQGVSGFDRGNPALNEEKSDSFTARFILAPRSIPALRNFGFTASYFNIRVKDAIVSTPRQFILDQCFGAGVQSFCSFLTRRPTAEGSNSAGSLDEIDSASTNSGGLRTRGVDFTVNYSQDLDTLLGIPGKINLTGSYTHMIEGVVFPLPGAAPDFFDGEVGSAKDRFFVSAGYSLDSFSVVFRGTYTGVSYLDDQFLAGFQDPSLPENQDADPDNDVQLDRRSKFGRVGPEFYGDVQLRYRPSDTFEFYVGADNVLNNKPPVLPSGLPGNITGTETASDVYDPFGRRFYAGATLRF